jgi:hypothetical protein
MPLGGVEPGGALAEWIASLGCCELGHGSEGDMREYMLVLKEGMVVTNGIMNEEVYT